MCRVMSDIFPKRLGTYTTCGHIHGSLVCPELSQRFPKKICNLYYMGTNSRISGLLRAMSGILSKDLGLMLHEDTFMDLWSVKSYVRNFSKKIGNLCYAYIHESVVCAESCQTFFQKIGNLYYISTD